MNVNDQQLSPNDILACLPARTAAQFVLLTLDDAQAKEVAEVLREAYCSGGAVFGEVRRDCGQAGAVVLGLGVVPRKPAEKIRATLDGVATAKGSQLA